MNVSQAAIALLSALAVFGALYQFVTHPQKTNTLLGAGATFITGTERALRGS